MPTAGGVVAEGPDRNRPAPAGALLLQMVAIMAGLYLSSRFSYQLFHTLVELFTIMVAAGMFVIAWNTRRFMANDYLLFIGIAYLFVASLDLLHMLTYKGMGVLPVSGVNLPTQLWVAARMLQASSLLIAPLTLRRQISPTTVFAAFAAVTTLLATMVFTGWFPDCYLEGVGLTPFKRWCEYVVIGLMAGALVHLFTLRNFFDRTVWRLLAGSIAVLAAAGGFFAFYVDVFGPANLLGHLFKWCGFYLIYKAVVETGLARPYDLLFRELKESELRYRIMGESVPFGFWLCGPDGAPRYFSRNFLDMVGITLEEAASKGWLRALPLADKEAVTAQWEHCMADVSEWEQELRLSARDGSERRVLSRGRPIRTYSGEVLCWVGINLDITERKKMEEEIEVLNTGLAAHAQELEELNRELEAFNSTVSHDLRTPLTVMSGYIQLLLMKEGGKLDAEERGFLEEINETVMDMSRLVNDLLDFSRLGRKELQRADVDISLICWDVAADLHMTCPERRVEFRVAEELHCHADPGLMRVVMENLLGNAWKYSSKQEHAVIEFGMTDARERQVYFVRDNGAGFDMAFASHLFLPFQRLHTDEFEGTGVGLATVHRIITRHGGSIWAESAPGEGATFYFTL